VAHTDKYGNRVRERDVKGNGDMQRKDWKNKGISKILSPKYLDLTLLYKQSCI